ncbi:hypothetical protein [Tahibacter amnicola]|uniref:Uncharacterized protein n=1 Tax=Tahibacter amnicola TaxID=2976241 RepID=A0ABY6BJ53_9GAMM|nr:hypothetical protein [Tahibacter amnicola]UXI69418.1 hypothetical protein N4264_07150 [Tahibacter amnicola]
MWNQDITAAPLHPQSANMIATWAGLGGFGNGRMQIDFGMNVVHAPLDAPRRTIVGYPYDEYYFPDCDAIGATMPVPANAAIEHSDGLSCDNESDDCHLLVVQGTTLFEAYHVTASGASGLEAQCLARWNLTANYPEQGRGDHCTSADAAGFPIAPLLLNADEVHAALSVPQGTVGHAIRFILPNPRMASDASLGGVNGRLYVRPATHAGSPSGPSGSVPYGVRLRLRSDFPMAGYSPAAQVILRTLQRYGMVLADGGNIAISAESDRYTTHTWAELGIGSRVFDQTPGARVVVPADFQVINTGPRIAETYDCERTVVADDVIFANGFQ